MEKMEKMAALQGSFFILAGWGLGILILLVASGCTKEAEDILKEMDQKITRVRITDKEELANTPLKVGRTIRLSARAENKEGVDVTIKDFLGEGGGKRVVFHWSSSNPQVAGVTSDGLLKALSAGRSTISVEAERVRDSVTITVIN